LSAFFAVPLVQAQVGQGLVEPIHRVAHEQPAEQLASRIAPPAVQVPFNLAQQPGEHPLMPALRVATKALSHIDSNIQGYTATMVKQERIGGVLGEQEAAFIKVRHQPFGVYMFFLKPNQGQECLYIDAPDGSKGMLQARGAGFKRRLGVFELDPEGSLAMKGQKYPIMKLGVRKLTTELIDVATADSKFGECEVHTSQCTMQDRPVTMIEVVHPVPRASFRFHKAQVFIDNELQIPVRYAAYLWPAAPGGEPVLEEAYTYLNVKVDNNLTDLDFDRNNPNYFK
jgi:hypothetical protein